VVFNIYALSEQIFFGICDVFAILKYSLLPPLTSCKY